MLLLESCVIALLLSFSYKMQKRVQPHLAQLTLFEVTII